LPLKFGFGWNIVDGGGWRHGIGLRFRSCCFYVHQKVKFSRALMIKWTFSDSTLWYVRRWLWVRFQVLILFYGNLFAKLHVMQSNVNALIDMKLEKHKNLREESGFYWREIYDGTLKFDRRESEVYMNIFYLIFFAHA